MPHLVVLSPTRIGSSRGGSMGCRAQYLYLFLLVAVVFPSVELAAQTAISGGLAGIVTDPSSAVLQNANVEIKDNSKATIHSSDLLPYFRTRVSVSPTRSDSPSQNRVTSLDRA